MNSFWKGILSSKDVNSSKRLITLIISAHFILSSFVILYVASYVIFYLPKGKVDNTLLSLLGDILEKDFWIILAGLGFISGEQWMNAYSKKAELIAQAAIRTGIPPADNVNIDIKKKDPDLDDSEGTKDTKRQ